MKRTANLCLVACALAVSSNAFGMLTLLRPFIPTRTTSYSRHIVHTVGPERAWEYATDIKDQNEKHEKIRKRNQRIGDALRKQRTTLKKIITSNNNDIKRLESRNKFYWNLKGCPNLYKEFNSLEQTITKELSLKEQNWIE